MNCWLKNFPAGNLNSIIMVSQAVTETDSETACFDSFAILLNGFQPSIHRKKPRKTLVFRGLYPSALNTYDAIFNYSIIDTTEPEPTVRPPSRKRSRVLYCFSCVFLFIYSLITAYFCSVSIVSGFFVIILLSHTVPASFIMQ